MAKKNKSKSKSAPVTPAASTPVASDGPRPLSLLPLLGLIAGAVFINVIYDWIAGTVWVLILSVFIFAWRMFLQKSAPNDPGAAS